MYKFIHFKKYLCLPFLFFCSQSWAEVRWIVNHIEKGGTKDSFHRITDKEKVWTKDILDWECGLTPEMKVAQGFFRSLMCKKSGAAVALQVVCSKTKRGGFQKAFLLGGKDNARITSIVLTCGYVE